MCNVIDYIYKMKFSRDSMQPNRFSLAYFYSTLFLRSCSDRACFHALCVGVACWLRCAKVFQWYFLGSRIVRCSLWNEILSGIKLCYVMNFLLCNVVGPSLLSCASPCPVIPVFLLCKPRAKKVASPYSPITHKYSWLFGPHYIKKFWKELISFV